MADPMEEPTGREWLLVEAETDFTNAAGSLGFGSVGSGGSGGPGSGGSGSGGSSIVSSSAKKKTRTRRRSSRELVSDQDAAYYQFISAQTAHQAIACLFSTDYLVQDCYIRSQMDREGWLPLLYIMSYPPCALSCSNLVSLESLLQLLAQSSLFELQASASGPLIRLSGDEWRKWLVPSSEAGGAYGRPQLYSEFATSTEGILQA